MMTNPTADDLYRKALETEAGEPISAGARVAHVRALLESGRALYVDLSSVPEEDRPALVSQIRELVNRAKEASRAKAGDASKPVV
jgi:hypothetical protein